MALSKDTRLIEQSAKGLRRVCDWLEALEHVRVDGIDLDKLGEVIHAVDTLEAEVEEMRR